MTDIFTAPPKRIKAKFVGGPADGQELDIPAEARMYHVPRLNSAGRLMIAVYHYDKQTDIFRHSYYINEGKEWRDD